MSTETKKRSGGKKVIFGAGLILSIAYVAPFLLVLLNSFKPKYDILSNRQNVEPTFCRTTFCRLRQNVERHFVVYVKMSNRHFVESRYRERSTFR